MRSKPNPFLEHHGELTPREEEVLLAILDCYTETGQPVGSRHLVRRFGLPISPATVRNTMADLEDLGYLRQPHTSAGRVPTDLAYRFYIDRLKSDHRLPRGIAAVIRKQVEAVHGDVAVLLETASRALASVSRQLALVTAPRFDEARLRSLRLVRIASERLLNVLELEGAPVRTVVFEISSGVADRSIERVEQYLNERLSGLRLVDIRQSIGERLEPLPGDQEERLRARYVAARDQIFYVSVGRPLYVGGLADFLDRFAEEGDRIAVPVFRILEDGERAVRVLSRVGRSPENAGIGVGRENAVEELREMSVVACRYRAGAGTGLIGLIGPTRMRYDTMIPVVEFTARELSARANDFPSA